MTVRNGSNSNRFDKSKNIIVLLLDTLRASDAYGNPAMPNLSNLYSKGTVYENAISPATWTAPSHASIFTAKRPSSIKEASHDFLADSSIDPWIVRIKFLPNDAKTLALKLHSMGYYSVLFSNNPFLSSNTNLAIGFDKIYDLWMNSNIKYNPKKAKLLTNFIKGEKVRKALFAATLSLSSFIPSSLLNRMYLNLRIKMAEGVAKADGTHKMDRGAIDTNKALKSYMESSYNYMPQFMFLNCIEAHENYPVSDKGIIQDKWLYLSGILEMDDYVTKQFHNAYLKRLRYLDKQMGKSLEILKKQGILDDASVIVTSDHGQFFGEHGLLYHSLHPYNEVNKVPLAVARFENGKLVSNHEIVEEPISLTQMHDIVLSMAGASPYAGRNVPVISEHNGISEGWDGMLLNALRRRSEYAARIYKTKTLFNSKSVSITHEGYKLIHFFGNKRDELYRVDDKKEEENIISSNRGIAKLLLSKA
ncbi:sulfatase-like hydrolase/transferase [Candidatus Marsarchaeota archaeon]|nr:sulfatase-like hydrolase/transferase [Candidatus Marsarchaeota archaeon]